MGKILFLAGYSRIGSTILERILNEIEGFVAVGELKYIWSSGMLYNHLCGCGRSFQSCSFWASVLEEAFGSLSGIDWRAMADLAAAATRSRHLGMLLTGRLNPTLQVRAQAYCDLLRNLYSALFLVSGARVVIDSSKHAKHAVLLAKAVHPEMSTLHVLHLLRDSRAVAYSWKRVKTKPEIPGSEIYMNRQSVGRSALEWTYFNIGASLLKRLDLPYQVMRYEDFATNPNSALPYVIEWLRERPSFVPKLSGGQINLSSTCHGLAGNPVRFSGPTIQLSLDQEWKSSMRLVDRSVVTAITWPLLLRYYLLRAR